MLDDYPALPMPTAASEIALIESFAQTRVIGVTINHENMTDEQITDVIDEYELDLGIPATDALARPIERLVDMVLQAYPALEPAPGRSPSSRRRRFSSRSQKQRDAGDTDPAAHVRTLQDRRTYRPAGPSARALQACAEEDRRAAARRPASERGTTHDVRR